MGDSHHFDHLFKLVLLGDSGVGKTNLLSRFTRNSFTTDEKSTIGVEFATKIMPMAGGKKEIKAQIWDTAGQERFRAITHAYYRGALGAMVVYDVTKKSSFEHVSQWISELREYANRDIVVVMVGNKCDTSESLREVTAEEAKLMAEEYEIPFFEASAKNGDNVDAAFTKIVETIFMNGFATPEKGVTVDPKSAGGQSKACCA